MAETANHCRHCGYPIPTPNGSGRGLCRRCWRDRRVRSWYPPVTRGRGPDKQPRANEDREPTAEEVERCVAEQMGCLPPWWGAVGGLRPPRWTVPVVRTRYRHNGHGMTA